MASIATLQDRFFAKVIPEPNSGCWLWLGALSPAGYGNFSGLGRRTIGAHRFSYILLVGRVPEGLVLDHKCRVKCCVNPDHLEPVTPLENFRRAVHRANEAKKAQTHCIRGHSFDEKNTIRKGKGRHCRACRLIRGRENKRMIRAASAVPPLAASILAILSDLHDGLDTEEIILRSGHPYICGALRSLVHRGLIRRNPNSRQWEEIA